MPTKKPSRSSKNKSISIKGDVRDSNVFIGDNNLFQKIINYIFPSEKETLEHRNRRILLNHVENAWIKGVLDASLHGAALLDLGIKQDPEAVIQYPWAIKKESTDETLPAGTSMLEIFDSIGMGRSLLILGAPGSGKTTMLLELARGLIARAREDVTQPIPMVFNLASWTEKLTLAGWLAQELNNLYSVPRKTAPDWVKGNKLLLLLDGLDEVRQDSRAKCVEAINEFRKQNGLTSLAVCSRSQDYADLNAKLSFEGAIEIQPLTQGQITEFFNRFGNEMTGIKQALEKDGALREMAETPLFLSIMIMAYRDKQDVKILVSKEEKTQRKYLFDTYIDRMFERSRLKNAPFEKQDILRWILWLVGKMIKHNAVPYLFEDMQSEWLDEKKQKQYSLIIGLISSLIIGLIVGLIGSLIGGLYFGGLYYGGLMIGGLIGGVIGGLFLGRLIGARTISSVDVLSWDFRKVKDKLIFVLIGSLIGGLTFGLIFGLIGGLSMGLSIGLIIGLIGGLIGEQVDRIAYPGQSLILSAKNFLFAFVGGGLISGLIHGLISGLFGGLVDELMFGLMFGLTSWLMFGLMFGLIYGGQFLVQHYTLRFILARNNLLPWRLVPFLDHCVDLIFLRRVGGGYIFVHRLLMEHFAEMYVEPPTSKGK